MTSVDPVRYTLPETNSPPLEVGHTKRTIVFQPSIVRFYVSFRKGIFWDKNDETPEGKGSCYLIIFFLPRIQKHNYTITIKYLNGKQPSNETYSTSQPWRIDNCITATSQKIKHWLRWKPPPCKANLVRFHLIAKSSFKIDLTAWERWGGSSFKHNIHGLIGWISQEWTSDWTNQTGSDFVNQLFNGCFWFP